MHILIAPNAFKNSLSAEAVSRAIQKGLIASGLHFSATIFPVGDGGDGTADILGKSLGAGPVHFKPTDPIGRVIETSFGWQERDRIAIIELANASGLRLLSPAEYDPLRASSRGTGQMIARALDMEAQKILLGIGGSATIDGGTGILSVLGMRFLDRKGDPIFQVPDQLDELAAIDSRSLDDRILKTQMVVLCDVKNPLLGKQGAAKIFGPQKGAGPKEIEKLEAGLEKFAAVTLNQTGMDMRQIESGGAAGGIAAGLAAWAGAKLVRGIEYFLDATGFDTELEKAGLVITGEGRLDAQTLEGKAPFGVAARAKKRSIPVIAMAGMIEPDDRSVLSAYFDELIEINPRPIDVDSAIKHASENLERAAKEIGIELSKRR